MSAPIRILVVDDETSARKRIAQLLAQADDTVLVGEASNGRQACEDIERLAPDLVFLDMEMPEMNGLEVVAAIGAARMPATIFATAYDCHALPAFDANAIDYLVKPFDSLRFSQALEKARRWLRGARLEQGRLQLGAVLEQLAPKQDKGRLLVRSGDKQLLLKTEDIFYISAEGNYVRLHTATGEHLMRETMTGMLERLEGGTFRRIHRSHIVNLDHLSKLLPWFGGDSLVMMANGARLTLTRNYRDALRGLL
jgi:two-component system, LytTR family, response regulator